MSYFSDNYSKVKFPVASKPTDIGLRRAQLGGIHALAAHFTIHKDPAIVVMPTGSGKTAVILLAPFILRVLRVLIITPSQLVRAQIADNARTLDVLKRIGALPQDIGVPRIGEITSRRTSLDSWEQLRDTDFVISTPNCISPGLEGIVKPPLDLFDLVLADEAHHSEAPRWADILQHFEQSAKALFTATPFRRDKREIKGRLIYHYPIREAHKDGIFGNIRFVAVTPGMREDHDSAIAREAERVFRKDQQDGLEHCVMVRTDSKAKANELKKVYESESSLKLQVIHSDHSLSFIKKTLEKLKTRELDGIICVAMLGEGFDFPQLKIAAVHAPHKSLAVTLQFIGRFARTSGAKLGEAKFLAVPQDIEAETEELYRESAVWQELVSNLSASRIDEEVKAKEIAASFEPLDLSENATKDFSLAMLQPYFHVTIYKTGDEPDFSQHPKFPPGMEVVWHAVSKEYCSAVILLREVTKPRWTNRDAFSKIEHDLLVLYFHKASSLLFINSTRRALEFYRLIGEYYGGGDCRLLSLNRINRVLAGIANPEFFSVGMKCSVQNSNTESYRMIAGPNAHKAISPTDGRLYHRGHVFGKGESEPGDQVTIGYSSSSKVWSNQTGRIAELIAWCEELATKLNSNVIVRTNTELDHLELKNRNTASSR